MCTYAQAMRYIEAQGMMVVERVSVCVNDCITYTDSDEDPTHQYADQGTKEESLNQHCPLCNEPRNNHHGQPRKVYMCTISHTHRKRTTMHMY
jgi:hypothetical protein